MWPSRRASPLSGEQQTEPFAAWASSDESLGLQLRALVPDIVDKLATQAKDPTIRVVRAVLVAGDQIFCMNS